MVSIAINAQLLSGETGYRRAGIHHYIANLLAHLPPRDHLHFTIFSRYQPDRLPPHGNLVSTAWPTQKPPVRILWEQTVWPLSAWRSQHDLLHSMAFVIPFWQPAPTVVTVYDLSFIHFPDNFPPFKRWYLTTQTRRSCRQARRVITISQSGREDVHRFFGVALERIDVVSPGVDPFFKPPPPAQITAFRSEKGLPEQFLLHVGTLQPRKNIPVLLEALARLNRPHLPLVLVGGKGWMYDEIFARVETLGLSGQVHFAGYVPDEELPLWYSAASLFVFPSVYEGFGMPVLQAMACGTPVVAANTSALPEAVGTAGLLFEPDEVDGLVSQMLVVLDNKEQAVTMRERGLRQAAAFSWDEAGHKMVDSYARALALRPHS